MAGDAPLVAACGQIAMATIIYGVDSVRSWVKRADVDEGFAAGTTSEDAERHRRVAHAHEAYDRRERAPRR